MPAASILFSVALIRWVASLRLSIASSRMASSLLAMLSTSFLLWPRLRQSGYNRSGRDAMRIGEGASPLPDPRRGRVPPVASPYIAVSAIQGLPPLTCTSTADQLVHAPRLARQGRRPPAVRAAGKKFSDLAHLGDAPPAPGELRYSYY